MLNELRGGGNLCLETGAGRKTDPKGGESSGDPLRNLRVLRSRRHGRHILLSTPRSPLEGAGGSLTGGERQTLDLPPGKARTTGTSPCETVGEPSCSALLGARTRGATGGCQQHPLHKVIRNSSAVTAAGLVSAGSACCPGLGSACCPGSGSACCPGSPCGRTAAGSDAATARAEERGRRGAENRSAAPAVPAQPKPAAKLDSECGRSEGSNAGAPGGSPGRERPGAAPTPPRPTDFWGTGNLPRKCRTPAAACRPSASATGACWGQGQDGLGLLRPSLCSQQPQHKQSKNITLRLKRGAWLPQMKRMSSARIPQQSRVRELGKVSPLQPNEFQ